jgi:outer membrane protein TolC
MIRKRLLLFFVLAILPVYVAAQTPGTKAAAQNENDTSKEVVRLSDLIDEALANNPAIQSGKHTVLAMRARVPQARALPDPVIGTGWMGGTLPFRASNPGDYRKFSIMQMFMYPGKRALMGQMAEKEADASQLDVATLRRQITAEVKAAYYEYWYNDKAIRTTQRKKELLRKFSQLAESRYGVGKGMGGASDVLMSQVEISMLTEKLTMQEQAKTTAQAKLNALLARDPETPLPPPEDVSGPSPLTYSLDELYSLARQNNPEYQKMQTMVEAKQVSVDLAKKANLPDLNVEYMYQQLPGMPDMKGLTVTMNIPIFYKSKQREQVKQLTQEGLSAARARDNMLNQIAMDIKMNYTMAQSA